MAAVMVRDMFEVRPPEWVAPTRPAAATPSRRSASARVARDAVGGGVVVDLQERRTRSVFDVEPEAVLRPDAALACTRLPAPSGTQAPPPLRIDRGVPRAVAPTTRSRSSRRAWLVVTAVALAIVGVAVTDDPAGGRLGGHDGGRTDAVPAASTEAVAPTLSIVVQPGDTLWSIAAALVGDDDPRPLVDVLQVAHGGADLHPGDVIIIPAP